MGKCKNIVYIHSHDSGKYFDVYGYEEAKTPALNAFAEEALCFDRAFCASPTCSPSRAALVTGRYPHSNGMLGLTNRGFTLADYDQHLVRCLNREGYETVLCGIQHEHGRYVNHAEGAAALGYQCNLTSDNRGMEEAELVEWDLRNSRAVVDWLAARESEQAFFLSFGLFATHRIYPEKMPDGTAGPSEACEVPGFLEDAAAVREDLAGHQRSLAYYDACLALVLDALKKKGCFEDTLIFVTSDHGLAFPQAKCTLRDAGIGVPLLMHVPGSAVMGKRTMSLFSQVDILPTLFELLGLSIPAECQGVSQAGLFRDPEAEFRDAIFAEVNFHTSYEPMRCVRTKRYKYIRYFDAEYRRYNLSNIDRSISKDYYMESGLLAGEKAEEQLYDLETDPYEQHNLAARPESAALLALLRERLTRWMRETDDPLLQGPIPFAANWKVNKSESLDPKSQRPEDFI